MKYAVYIVMIAVGVLAGCGRTDDKAAPGKESATVTQQAPEKLVQQEAPAGPKHVSDVQAGKQLAKEVCASCHGMNGAHSESGTPFIAGLKEGYIAASLQSYVDGSRNVTTVKAAADKLKVLKQLKPEQISDVSAYYASLDTPWKGAGVGIPRKKAEIPITKDNIQAGADIAKRCNSCHGDEGNSFDHPDVPSLAAMPPDYFIYSMKTYFDERRKNKVMGIFGMGNSLSDKMLGQLAAYYAVQTPQKPPALAQGNAQLGAAYANNCEGCHGFEGNSLNPGLPNLAGQPAEYLAFAMRAYRDGKRKDAAMKFALKEMSDGRIADLAAYFSAQEPISLYRWKTQSAKEFRPVEDGKRIARMCDSCHGKDGNSTKPGIPSLTGFTAKYLAEATIAYRDGVKKHEAMREMVSFLKDDDIEKVSLYYALQEPVATKKPGKFDLAAGEKIRTACSLCHSDEGIKKDPSMPNLNGQDHQYLIDATMAYADGKRDNVDMKWIAKAIKPQEHSNLVNVTGYYTAQKANKPHTVMPQPPMKTIEKCHRCHGEKGETSTASLPRLAGQSEGYLVGAMKAYQDMKRKNQAMIETHADLSLMEMKGIAAYYAKQ